MAAPKKIWIIIAFAAVYLIWGSTYLGILFAIQSIPPFLMAGVRFFSAGVIMYGIARLQGAPKPERSTWWTALIIGACLLLGGNGGVTISEKWVPTGLAALLVATVPIYIALLGWLSGTAARPTSIVWLDRRFYRSRNFGWARIHEFNRKSSRMGYVDLAHRVLTLVRRVALLAQG